MAKASIYIRGHEVAPFSVNDAIGDRVAVGVPVKFCVCSRPNIPLAHASYGGSFGSIGPLSVGGWFCSGSLDAMKSAWGAA